MRPPWCYQRGACQLHGCQDPLYCTQVWEAVRLGWQAARAKGGDDQGHREQHHQDPPAGHP